MKRGIVSCIFRCLTVICLALSLVMTGCSRGHETVRQSDTDGEVDLRQNIKIGVTFDSFVNERWLKDRDILTSSARALGAEVYVQNANGSVKEQVSQISKFVENHMDVIIIVAVDSSGLGSAVKQAHDHDIPVIAYDRLILDADVDLYISFDNEQVGSLMADAIISSIPQGGRIVKINGPSKDNNVKLVNEGFDKEIEGNDIVVVDSYSASEWKGEEAFNYLTDKGDLLGEVDAIMCGNDSLAGQAIRYLAERRMAGDVCVVGQDADLDACQRIVEGTQNMTVYKPIENLASIAARSAVDLAMGTLPETDETVSDGSHDVPYVRVEVLPVDRTNMDEVVIDSGFHMRSDVYLNVAD